MFERVLRLLSWMEVECYKGSRALWAKQSALKKQQSVLKKDRVFEICAETVLMEVECFEGSR